jgi:EAL domain-containing protein (putative c-di-GMP-specific phosphodiesterase class I)
MRIVVEGIEHQQQIDLFTNLGAERLQGWILDKPMSLQSLISKT